MRRHRAGAREAICSWGNKWAEATAAGDAGNRAAAISGLRGALSWPAVTDIDVDQTYGPSEKWTDARTGRSGVYYPQETEFAYLPRVVEAADGQDLILMQTLLVDCWDELVPALPRASTVTGQG